MNVMKDILVKIRTLNNAAQKIKEMPVDAEEPYNAVENAVLFVPQTKLGHPMPHRQYLLLQTS